MINFLSYLINLLVYLISLLSYLISNFLSVNFLILSYLILCYQIITLSNGDEQLYRYTIDTFPTKVSLQAALKSDVGVPYLTAQKKSVNKDIVDRVDSRSG